MESANHRATVQILTRKFGSRAPAAGGGRASGPLAILVRSCRLSSRTAPQFQFSLVNFGSEGGTKIPVPCCGIRGTTWGERAIEDLASRRLVVVHLHCRVRHGYRVRGSNSARLGGSSGGSPPARTGSDGRTGGAHFSSCLSRGCPWGVSGGWAHPRAATTYVPRGRSRFSRIRCPRQDASQSH